MFRMSGCCVRCCGSIWTTCCVQDVLDEWLLCQMLWLYLDHVLCAGRVGRVAAVPEAVALSGPRVVCRTCWTSGCCARGGGSIWTTCCVQDVLDEWLLCQRRWLYLDHVLCAGRVGRVAAVPEAVALSGPRVMCRTCWTSGSCARGGGSIWTTCCVQDVLDEWLLCQRRWLYLDHVLCAGRAGRVAAVPEAVALPGPRVVCRTCWTSGCCARGSGSTWSRSSTRRTSRASCLSRASDTRRWNACGARS